MSYTNFAIIVTIVIAIFLTLKYISLAKENRYLKKSTDLAEKQSQLSRDFIASLSQELRTPLYGIMGLTNVLVEEYPHLENDKNLKSLKFTGDYLLNLINNILQVNYADKVEFIPLMHHIDLKELTQNLVNSFNYLTEHKNNILHFDFNENIHPTLCGDGALISQILMNLISNALRFTRNGNVYFSVDLIKIKENRDTISFRVKHDGNKISKEDEKSIYEEFINIGNAKKSYLGTGIDAIIVKRLVTALNGEIIIDENQTGSEYAFVMEFEILETIPSEYVDITINKSDRAEILVVDDNKLNLLVADKILSEEHFNCTTVDNGFDAIDMLKDKKYDIILMDINMPILNGIGTTKRIREFNKNIPIIALTAVDVTQLNRQILQAGLNDYILKPYDKLGLLEKINKFLYKSTIVQEDHQCNLE